MPNMMTQDINRQQKPTLPQPQQQKAVTAPMPQPQQPQIHHQKTVPNPSQPLPTFQPKLTHTQSIPQSDKPSLDYCTDFKYSYKIDDITIVRVNSQGTCQKMFTINQNYVQKLVQISDTKVMLIGGCSDTDRKITVNDTHIIDFEQQPVTMVKKASLLVDRMAFGLGLSQDKNRIYV